jgi:hypothetical protein
MKSIMLALVLAGGIWGADEVSDRAAIEKTIAKLNFSPVPAGLFTTDFEDQAELARFRGPAPAGELVISKEPWGEAVWVPGGANIPFTHIKTTRIRFLTPGVAMADVDGNGRAVMVLRKEGAVWKIASLRILARRSGNAGVDF